MAEVKYYWAMYTNWRSRNSVCQGESIADSSNKLNVIEQLQNTVKEAKAYKIELIFGSEVFSIRQILIEGPPRNIWRLDDVRKNPPKPTRTVVPHQPVERLWLDSLCLTPLQVVSDDNR